MQTFLVSIKAHLTLQEINGPVEPLTESKMTEIDLNKTEPGDHPEVIGDKPEHKTEADDSEAKVAADEAEKEKKVKKHKNKAGILSSFR